MSQNAKARKTPQGRLQGKFSSKERFRNFGNVLTRMCVTGFRGHQRTDISFRSPVTAFCGLNGAGKSTIIQLAAAAYKNIEGPSFFVHDFFARHPQLDRNAFSAGTQVRFEYCSESGDPSKTTLSRDASDRSWKGYRKRPERRVFFAGVSHYLPLWERGDFVFRFADKLAIGAPEALAHKRSCEILGIDYNRRQRHAAGYRKKEDWIVSVERIEASYSETNMGFGEARIQYILDELESLPPQSLVLFEEPETSLHPRAQSRMGSYLIELAAEKGHQILLTTHSDWLLRALPTQSIVFLTNTSTGVQAWPGIHPLYAANLLNEGHERLFTILVEDECAKVVLAEMVRVVDPDFLRVLRIVPAGFRPDESTHRGGGRDAIVRVMESLRQASLGLAAVLDGNESEDPPNRVFKLPGTLAPEDEILKSQNVRQFFSDNYRLTMMKVKELIDGHVHQRYFDLIADYLVTSGEQLRGELAREYAKGLPISVVEGLVNHLKSIAHSQS